MRSNFPYAPSRRTVNRVLAGFAAATFLLFTQGSPASQVFAEHVIHLSVDGLHVDAVATLLEAPGELVPNFRRLRDEGVFTDNARTDALFANTLPNHTSEITSRPVLGADGHGWFINSDPDVDPPLTLHALKGDYVASVFDVVHDHGLSTALYANKSKFEVFDRSFDADNGAEDVLGADDGRDKIDTYVSSGDMDTLVNAFVEDMARERYDYVLLHLREPDSTGHDSGWDLSLEPLSAYLEAVRRVDAKLGQLFAMLDADPVLRAGSVIILTADHGGQLGTKTHSISRRRGWIDSGMVPFLVWGPESGVVQGDLYALNPRRLDPGDRLPFTLTFLAPVRNGDSANLALHLLGLPPVPGSVINAAQDLWVGQ
jgi:predicted AlkP superfamily pyrophosphatase or phosphodiesterase